MPRTPRTFILDQPPLQGSDVKEWQKDVAQAFAKMGIDCPIVIDGLYGQGTRSYTAALCRASGLTAAKAMAHGVTPELRSKLRHQDLNKREQAVKDSKARKEYRAALRKRWSAPNVHVPVTKIVEHSWGFHPGVHDGLDVICLPKAPLFAMVKSKVVDARSSGWWGLGAPSNQAVKAQGDGIIQLQVLETVGPFKRGHHIGYGHAEGALVKVGDIVDAGHHIGHAGMANAWHIHLMYNTGDTTKGIGRLDPEPLIDYVLKHR